MGCIYKVTNLINNKIYIGYTKKDKEYRWKKHLQTSNYKKYKKSALHDAIRKYGDKNFIIENIIEGDFSVEELSNLEKKYIKEYNSFSEIGYNLNVGGCGGKLYERTPEILAKISNSLKGHSYNKGIKKSKEHKEKLSKAIKKLADNGFKPASKKVYQYDLNDNLLNEFNSLEEASKKLNINRTTILNIVKGKTKNPKLGFKFKTSKRND